MCDFRGRGTDLQIHLLVEHHCQERGLMMFVQQILRLLPVTTESWLGCRFCGMARDDLRAHLIACPTLIQISSLIALPIHERFWLGVHGGRFHGAIIPRLGPVGNHGKRSGAPQEGQNRPKQARSTTGNLLCEISLIRAMGQLMLRHDQDLQTSAMQGTFILYLVPSQEGSIPLLQMAHRQWTDLKEKSSTLRTHLILALLRELQRRLVKLMACSDQDPLKVTMVKNGILLEDLTWPYTQWDQTSKKLILSKTKTPTPMTAAQELLEELLTLVKEEGAIQRFHSLSRQESTRSQPWKLQVGQRNDRLHHLLTKNCHLSLWQIAGIQMKASPLAGKVKDMLQHL